MILYRGDNKRNYKTKPGLFRSNGLITTAFGSNADSDNLEKTGIIQCVRHHVRHNSKRKMIYYGVSDFLSFTESLERARYWCSGIDKVKLVPAIEYSETRYIFEMTIDSSKIDKLEDGIYTYKYCCNLKLRKADSKFSLLNGAFKLANNIYICPICNSKDLNHELILINSHEFLIANFSKEVSLKEIKLAKSDKEWLVLPNDLEQRTGSRLTRIQRANFWKAHLFN